MRLKLKHMTKTLLKSWKPKRNQKANENSERKKNLWHRPEIKRKREVMSSWPTGMSNIFRYIKLRNHRSVSKDGLSTADVSEISPKKVSKAFVAISQNGWLAMWTDSRQQSDTNSESLSQEKQPLSSASIATISIPPIVFNFFHSSSHHLLPHKIVSHTPSRSLISTDNERSQSYLSCI